MGGTPTKKGLTRLTEIEVDEVSLVDAGANNRRLLVVKSKEAEGTMGTNAGGTEVRLDGKGGATPVNKNEGTPAAAPLQLSAARKAALKKSIAEAQALLKSLEAQVEGAKVVEGSEEVPEEVAKNLSGAATLLVDVAPEAVAKAGFKQVTPTRLDTLRAAHQQLGELIGAVQPTAKDPAAAAAPAQAAPAVNEETTKAVNELGKSMKELQTSVTSTLQTMEKALLAQGEQLKAQGEAVTKQAGKLAELEGARGSSNGTPEAAPVTKAKPKRTSWPSDLGTAANEKKQEQGRSS